MFIFVAISKNLIMNYNTRVQLYFLLRLIFSSSKGLSHPRRLSVRKYFQSVNQNNRDVIDLTNWKQLFRFVRKCVTMTI